MRVNFFAENVWVEGTGVSAYLHDLDALKREGIETVINSPKNDYDIFHSYTIGPSYLIRAIRNKGHCVVTAGFVPDSLSGSVVFSDFLSSLVTRYMRYAYNLADVVLAVSPYVKRELKNIGVRARIENLPHCIDRKKFKKSSKLAKNFRKKFSIGKDDFVILGVGQVQPRKGIETFCNVAKELPELKFVWVGDIIAGLLAAQRSEMKKLMKNPPSGNILFTGLVNFKELIGAYSSSKVFFLPSYNETFGRAILEASAFGLPLVLRDLKVYKDIFTPNYLSGKDGKSFAEEISSLYGEKSFYKKYSRKSANLSAKYDSHRVLKRQIEIYESLLRGKK